MPPIVAWEGMQQSHPLMIADHHPHRWQRQLPPSRSYYEQADEQQ